jgi:hypothetical protein
MNNYLLKILESYYLEIAAIEGRLTTVESFIIAKRTDIINENRRDGSIVDLITSYRDISLVKANDNLFTPNFHYSLSLNNLEKETNDIISQHCCFAISQSYEVFESFLIEILTEYLLYNQEKLKIVKFIEEDIILIRQTIRDMVRGNQKSNNKGLLSMIRKLSSHFKMYESKNIYKVNISQWFDLVSMIRHVLVHNRQIVSNNLLNYLAKTKSNDMFERHFQRKKIGNNICIYLERTITIDIITWLNTFAHFIFKSLSIEANLPLQIPQYNPPPLKLYRYLLT